MVEWRVDGRRDELRPLLSIAVEGVADLEFPLKSLNFHRHVQVDQILKTCRALVAPVVHYILSEYAPLRRQ